MAREPVTEAGSGSKICPRRHYHNMDPSALVRSLLSTLSKQSSSWTMMGSVCMPSIMTMPILPPKNRGILKRIFSARRIKMTLMLMTVLNCLFDSLSQMLRKNVEKKSLMENMDGVLLIMDEIVDGGVILESDPQQVIQKVNFRVDDTPLTEQSMAQLTLSLSGLAHRGCSFNHGTSIMRKSSAEERGRNVLGTDVKVLTLRRINDSRKY
ncbi:uncharacterized protein LOC119954120 isoform X3 [Scyliorhinus canicula]|uniref:uncharacterized protein LOC119954120 isoform X3 n=1 Tax=Scyliorhinus canicula TaxID=7830 RepID=UPI0018F2E876|nr:uncharacterized protein LOC119954120 isoform X3 [Scyliorhinus canicula]